MEFKDLFITPIYLLLIYAFAFFIRNKVTNRFTKKYFIPAITVKLIGAISVGLIYQFYYGGGKETGDTFHYFRNIRIMFDAFLESPAVWLKLMLSNGEYNLDTIKYASRIDWYDSPTEFIIIKIGSFFSLFCFNSYPVIAMFFALFSFSGLWKLYNTFISLYPQLYKKFALAVFFLPSVFFWGSGLLKDSITIGALGWLFYGFYTLFIIKTRVLPSLFIIIFSALLIYSIKVYILLSFLPPAFFWIFNENSARIKNTLIRALIKPVFIAVGLVIAYFGATTLTKGDERYDVTKIVETTKTNRDYLTYQQENGSAYEIGVFDGSLSSILIVGPQAITVSLFRPFIWEVRNPVMLLSALEASMFIYLTIMLIVRAGIFKTLKEIAINPVVNFLIIFSLVLAFGVGTNSGNFGTLVRYKIPLMPFYLSALYIMALPGSQKIASKKPPKSRLATA